MREAVISRPPRFILSTVISLWIVVAAAAVIQLQKKSAHSARALVQGSETQDTLGPGEIDVITMRFEGLTVAGLRVSATPRSRLKCSVFGPDQIMLQTMRSGPECSLKWLAPKSGAYRIEIKNQSTIAVTYSITEE